MLQYEGHTMNLHLINHPWLYPQVISQTYMPENRHKGAESSIDLFCLSGISVFSYN